MFNLSETAKKMILIICVLFVIILVGSCFFFRDAVKVAGFALGLLMGGGLAVLKVVLLEKTIDRSVDMEQKQANNFAVAMFVARYFLTGMVLIVAAVVPMVNLWGAVIGILLLQIAAYAVSIILKNDSKKI